MTFAFPKLVDISYTMDIKRSFSLKAYNTFGIDIHCKFFAEVSTKAELLFLLSHHDFKKEKKLILGGGSNILFTDDFDGLIIKLNFQDINIEYEDEYFVFIKAGAGVVWHDLVNFTINKNFGGLENLSLIPGTVGASPIQNIGAYGVELKDVFDSLVAINIESLEERVFNKQDCKFGYRDSIFKQELKNKYIITDVIFKLSKKHELNTSYGDILKTLAELDIKELNISSVSKTICHIRSKKLPDPKEIGNAGSFFKNPEIPLAQFEAIKKDYPDIVSYKTNSPEMLKVPAGWLIEKCGWKGKRFDNYGVHVNQALVLVNYGNANGNDIKNLSEQIKYSVFEKFKIKLEIEVNIT